MLGGRRNRMRRHQRFQTLKVEPRRTELRRKCKSERKTHQKHIADDPDGRHVVHVLQHQMVGQPMHLCPVELGTDQGTPTWLILSESAEADSRQCQKGKSLLRVKWAKLTSLYHHNLDVEHVAQCV